MTLETRSTSQKQSVLNRYSRYLFKPLPQVPSFRLALAIDHLISKNPVVRVLINSSLVLLVEYAPFYLLVNVCCQLLRLCKCASSIASNSHLRSTSRSDAIRLGRDQLSRGTR